MFRIFSTGVIFFRSSEPHSVTAKKQSLFAWYMSAIYHKAHENIWNIKSRFMTTITWKGDLTLPNIEALYHSISEMKIENHFNIEFQNLQKWDVAGLQFMYSLKRHFLIKEIEITYSFHDKNSSSVEWMELINAYPHQ